MQNDMDLDVLRGGKVPSIAPGEREERDTSFTFPSLPVDILSDDSREVLTILTQLTLLSSSCVVVLRMLFLHTK
jgi:hypothetical protein